MHQSPPPAPRSPGDIEPLTMVLSLHLPDGLAAYVGDTSEATLSKLDIPISHHKRTRSSISHPLSNILCGISSLRILTMFLAIIAKPFLYLPERLPWMRR